MLRAIALLSAGIVAVGLTTHKHSTTPTTVVQKATVKLSCKFAERAIVYYRKQTWKYQRKLKQERHATSYPERRKNACPYKRYLTRVWQAYTIAARVQWKAYLYHYAWWLWLPEKWQRIGACETGYGRRPGNWKWNSGTYQGAFGFHYSTWDRYRPSGAPSEAYLATPRQQYQAALNVYAHHGYGAWGCGGA